MYQVSTAEARLTLQEQKRARLSIRRAREEEEHQQHSSVDLAGSRTL